MSDYLDTLAKYSYEQLVLFADPESGLRGAIAIHDTTLGPALGGCRMWAHPTEEAGINDVLRLARAMSYKNAAAGLNLGGGKAIILGDPSKDKSEKLFRALARQVDYLGGRYVTTEDVGTTEQDMRVIASVTKHITGLPISEGGSGDPSPATGWGVYQAMRACAKVALGTDDLAGKRVAVMGLGKVGTYTMEHLHRAGARLYGTDISTARVKEAQQRFGLTPVDAKDFFAQECDIFAPCALGGVLNKDTIPMLRAPIVCGGANNQLLNEEEDSRALAQRGILYGPDYIANAGGVINLSFEIGRTYDQQEAFARVARIYDTMSSVIATAKKEKTTTYHAANRLAEARLMGKR